MLLLFRSTFRETRTKNHAARAKVNLNPVLNVPLPDPDQNVVDQRQIRGQARSQEGLRGDRHLFEELLAALQTGA